MSPEASEITAKQEALGTTVTDLVRIVGKLDKKIDTGFNKLASDIASIKVDTLYTKQQLDELQADTLNTKQRLDELQADNAEMKAILKLILSRLSQ